jgi:TonB family protein
MQHLGQTGMLFLTGVLACTASEAGTLCGRVLSVTCRANAVRLSIEQEDEPVSMLLRGENRLALALDLLYKEVCIDKSKRKRPQLTDFRVSDSKTPIAPLDSGALHPCMAPDLQLPVPTHQERPVYPPEVMDIGVQGPVWIEAVIEADGSLGATRVLRSPNLNGQLAAEALRTIKRWRFTPGTRQGTPVPVLVVFEINFELRGQFQAPDDD